MDKKQIQSALQDALEEKVPAQEVNLWRAVKSDLVAGTHNQQGVNMNTNQPRRLSRLAYVSLTIMALLGLAFSTPQGRAFAQSLLQFFTRAERNSFPVQVTTPDPFAPTAVAPAPLISVAEAEAQAGFDLAELPSIPQGFEYLGARLYGESVSIEYAAVGGGGNLILMQSQHGFLESDWDQVPAEAILPVKVGDADAEYVQGTFVVMAGETSATWNAGASILRLRWMKDGIWFNLTKFGDVQPIEYLDKDGLIALAESIGNVPFGLTVKEAETQAGFEVLEPTALPAGMTFLGASVDTLRDLVSLSVGYSVDDRRILINQQPVNSPEACELCGIVGASASVQTLQIGETTGEYAQGVWKLTDNGPIWQDDPWLQTLRWQKDGMAFEIVYMGNPDEITPADLIALAESLQ